MYAEQTAQIVDILETQKLKLDEEKCLQDASYKACWDVQVSLYIILLFLDTNVAFAVVSQVSRLMLYETRDGREVVERVFGTKSRRMKTT